MICPINTQGFYGDQWGLVTAIVLGFFFGFSLERAGFGNARKLAAQFYGYDMTVFKVMFTAVLVAMVGLYAFVAFGVMDLDQLWINPTYLWAQLIGGFMLGIGFAVSGLCPGTSVVSAASGRIDGFVTVAGAFFGTFLFSLFMDWFPGLRTLYGAGFQGRSLLHDLLGMPAAWLALIIVVVALGAFLGAEVLERKLSGKFAPVPLTPTGGGKVKYYLSGALALVALISGLMGAPDSLTAKAPLIQPYEPLSIAEALIRGDAGLTILDLRDETARAEGFIPGARPASLGLDAETLDGLLAFAAPGSTVLLVDASGMAPELDMSWRGDLVYRYLRGGFAAWQSEVLEPREMNGGSMTEREAARRQNQIAAYFSGTEAKVQSSAPPPPAPTGGPKKKKADGGC
jgi:rhodanese-related sulfurtransferase/uncharacterized membrane protein YedE/YeeE